MTEEVIWESKWTKYSVSAKRLLSKSTLLRFHYNVLKQMSFPSL